ncbi:hypothetical protein ACIBEF_21575 [Micromonospora sp. NPDC050795]|uniref:ApeA N-terminal domain 1-containing protein n=1 Tax=Micromonospora sp. NPDC050795 TaxID=3364282 RepID=UPI0037A09A22
MLLDIVGTGRTTSFGGSSASVTRYKARTLVAGLDVTQIINAKLRSMSAHCFGISSWFGIRAIDEDWGRHPGSARLKSFALTVDTLPEQIITLGSGRDLVITAHWRVGGTEDQRTIHAPISITCRSRLAKPLFQLRQPLLRLQDLISLAYGGHVLASAGQAVPDLKEAGSPQSTPELWDYHLMVRPPGVQAVKDKDLPYFYLAEIGGMAGIGRWVRLCQTHPRAIRPLVERFRLGKPSAPLRLMEIAAGMEYWIKVNQSQRAWAKLRCSQRRHGCGFSWPIASYVGSSFTEWCGDPHRWAQKFWGAYNRLKHDPGAVDEYEVSLLADSGHLLLTAALLNRVALGRMPAKSIFQNSTHRTWQLKEQIRSLLI